jgi:hypothetical protein
MLLATFRCRAAIARRSQRRLSRIAKVAMAAVLNDQSGDFRVAMDDPYDLVLGMFALAVTAVMLARLRRPIDDAKCPAWIVERWLDQQPGERRPSRVVRLP